MNLSGKSLIGLFLLLSIAIILFAIVETSSYSILPIYFPCDSTADCTKYNLEIPKDNCTYKAQCINHDCMICPVKTNLTDDALINISNKFIMSKVGEELFTKRYKLEYVKPTERALCIHPIRHNSYQGIIEIKVYYSVKLNDTKIEDQYVVLNGCNGKVVGSHIYLKNTTPKINKTEALGIAENTGLKKGGGYNISLKQKYGELIWHVYSSKNCFVDINAMNGKIVDENLCTIGYEIHKFVKLLKYLKEEIILGAIVLSFTVGFIIHKRMKLIDALISILITLSFLSSVFAIIPSNFYISLIGPGLLLTALILMIIFHNKKIDEKPSTLWYWIIINGWIVSLFSNPIIYFISQYGYIDGFFLLIHSLVIPMVMSFALGSYFSSDKKFVRNVLLIALSIYLIVLIPFIFASLLYISPTIVDLILLLLIVISLLGTPMIEIPLILAMHKKLTEDKLSKILIILLVINLIINSVFLYLFTLKQFC